MMLAFCLIAATICAALNQPELANSWLTTAAIIIIIQQDKQP